MSLQLGLLHVSPLDPHVARNQESCGRIVSVLDVAHFRGEEGTVQMRTSLAPPQRNKSFAILARSYDNARDSCAQEERLRNSELSGS